MALQVGELYAEITADQSGLDKGIQDTKGKLSGLGGWVGSAFAGVMASAIAAIGGAIVGGVAAVNDYQKSLNGLQAQTGATSEEMKSMGEAIKGIYARNIGESFQDIADAMAYAKQATGAVGEELEYLTQDALMLRDTFGMDVKESLRGASQLMKEFGLTGTEAMSMIAEGTQKGLDRAGDLIDTVDEYSVYFKTAGLSAQDMFAIFENASAAGVRNLDYVGDAFKELVIRTKDGSATTKEAFEELGLNAEEMSQKFAAGGEKGREAFLQLMEALNAMEDPVQKNITGVKLFGTKFEDLEAEAIAAMGNLNGTIDGSVKKLEEIKKIKYDDVGTAIRGIGRQFVVGLVMPLGEKVLPYLNDFANWINSKIPEIQKVFSNLGKAIGPSFSAIGEQLSGLKAAFAPAVESLQNAFSGLGPKIQEAAPLLQSFKETFSNVFSGIGQLVSSVIGFIGPMIMSVIGAVIDWWAKNGQEFLSAFKTVFNGILAVINFVMPLVKIIIGSIFESIKGVILGALNTISGLFKIFAGIFTGDWSKMWEGIKQLFSGALQFLWNLFSLMMIGKLIGGIKAFITSGWNLFKQFGTAVKGTFDDLVKGAINLFNNFRAQGMSIWQSIVNTIKNLVSTFVNAVKNNFSQLWSNVKTTFENIKNAIINPVQTAKNKVKGFVEEIKSFFRNMKLQLPKIKMPRFKVKNWSKNPADWVKAMPTLSVEWYKTGGIATGPAIAGIGEAGSEAIVPLAGRRMLPFSQSIAEQLASMFAGHTQSATNNSASQTVVVLEIDGKRFARAVAKPMDEAITEHKRIVNREWGDI